MEQKIIHILNGQLNVNLKFQVNLNLNAKNIIIGRTDPAFWFQISKSNLKINE